MTYTGIEGISWIKTFVMPFQGRLSEIKMANVVLGWILRASGVEDLPHSVLDFHRVEALLHDVVLMEYLAEEMAIVEGMLDL